MTISIIVAAFVTGVVITARLAKTARTKRTQAAASIARTSGLYTTAFANLALYQMAHLFAEQRGLHTYVEVAIILVALIVTFFLFVRWQDHPDFDPPSPSVESD